MSIRSNRLADRLQKGADDLAAFANRLTAEQWRTRLPHDGRPVGVVIHHVAMRYPLDIQFARALAAGRPLRGVTAESQLRLAADHARVFAAVKPAAALDLLWRNAAEAASVVRSFTDRQLDGTAIASLYGGVVVSCEFLLEDRGIGHAYHHLAQIRATLGQLPDDIYLPTLPETGTAAA
jgi:hypothetical protein